MLIRKRKLLAVSSIALSIFGSSAFADAIRSYENEQDKDLAVAVPAKPDRQNASPRPASRRAAGRGYSVLAYTPDGSTYAGAHQEAAQAASTGSVPALSTSTVIAEARRYIGTNPTKRRSLWCGTFMNMVLERTGYPRGKSDLAKSFASYGPRVSGPQVGAIAVMSRGPTGGHVGVVTGIDPSGNPIVISGNHEGRVAEVPYPRGRIFAYVMPDASGPMAGGVKQVGATTADSTTREN